jgi:hypothetical protein
LHGAGGIDVGSTDLEMTLANNSSDPLIVTSVEAKIVGISPAPVGAYAGVHVQGAAGLDQFVVPLPGSGARASVPLYRRKGQFSYAWDSTPFFAHHVVTLRPHEVYPLEITVQTGIREAVTYRFVIQWQTSSGDSTLVTAKRFEIAGWDRAPVGTAAAYHVRYFNLSEACRLTGGANPWMQVDSLAQEASLSSPKTCARLDAAGMAASGDG